MTPTLVHRRVVTGHVTHKCKQNDLPKSMKFFMDNGRGL